MLTRALPAVFSLPTVLSMLFSVEAPAPLPFFPLAAPEASVLPSGPEASVLPPVPDGPALSELAPVAPGRIIAVNARIAKRVNQLQPSVKQRLAQVARSLPKRVKILVTSAYRTNDEQRRLRPTFGVKAKPGHSAHEAGRAIDVNVIVNGKIISPRKNKAAIGQVMAAAGFEYLGHHDPVHFAVPKDEIDPYLIDCPDIPVRTMAEDKAVQRQLALATRNALNL